tara:strand:+ start:607 stop:1542 length:936 start_codon:yes stop_codon:yes gene_type:complete
MLSEKPKVSVIMSVYNDIGMLRDSIESILNQTYSNFEFLIADDGSSTKEVESIICSYDDPRVKFFKNENNLGLAKTLNNLIDISKGSLLARMDSDDVALPRRLEVQVDYLDNNPNVDIVAGSTSCFPGPERQWIIKDCDLDLKLNLIWGNAIPHPTVMMRRKKIIDNNLYYDANLKYAQDYDLWARCSLFLNFGSVEDVILKYNIEGFNERKKRVQAMVSREVQARLLRDKYGLNISRRALSWLNGEPSSLLGFFEYLRLLAKLKQSLVAVSERKAFEAKVLHRVLWQTKKLPRHNKVMYKVAMSLFRKIS